MTSQLTFGNKENPCIVHEGEEIFVSRSCGMSTVIFWEDSETNALSVAMVERGPLMPDEVGKWHFPSGYLDRDETVYEGMKREVWEETGLDIASLCETYGVGESFDQPYAIDSTPS